MIETIVQIENGKYPFDQSAEKGQAIRIQDIQYFSNVKELSEKKNQMIKKTKLVKSHYIVKLLKIYQEQNSLHYMYQHIPYSFQKYIQKNYRKGSKQIVEMSSKLFLKKISYELAMLISYLIDMRIEIDLSLNNVGLTEDEKLKVFMNYRCKMGHKTEVSLIIYYNSRKQKILSFIEKQLNKQRQDQEKNPPNFYIKGNKLVFPEVSINQSYQYPTTPQPRISEPGLGFGGFQAGGFDNFTITPNQTSQAGTSFTDYQNMFFSAQNPAPKEEPQNENEDRFESTHSCIGFSPKKNKHQDNIYSRQTTHDLGRNKRFQNPKREAFSANKDPRSHKNSFHFGAGNRKEAPKGDYDDDNFDSKSFTHSKSVRIQFQQKMNNKKKKNRKDSYKVKITTFHEYEMDNCDPKDIFANVPKGGEEDIFDYFNKQGQKAQENHEKQQEEEQEKPSKYSSCSFIPETDTPKSPSCFVRKQSMPQCVTSTVGSTTRDLEEKVRLAKQKAQNVLSKYLIKKKTKEFQEENPPS